MAAITRPRAPAPVVSNPQTSRYSQPKSRISILLPPNSVLMARISQLAPRKALSPQGKFLALHTTITLAVRLAVPSMVAALATRRADPRRQVRTACRCQLERRVYGILAVHHHDGVEAEIAVLKEKSRYGNRGETELLGTDMCKA